MENGNFRISKRNMMQEVTTVSEILKEEILEGFSSNPKYIPSKYFYDDEGSRIFQKIMRMDEYYLTDCEYEIFENKKENILNKIRLDGEGIELIELGAGDGLKTSVLIEHFINQEVNFNYIPVDISEQAIESLVNKMKGKFPSIHLNEKIGDYFEIMNNLKSYGNFRRLALFLGSNIGNYSIEESTYFFQQLSSVMNEGDMVLTGFDLVKDPEIILKAYNDPGGYTMEFNMNLLKRLNRELGANFNPGNFLHYPVYDPLEKAAKSYLISKESQEVYFKELDKTFSFNKWESIFTEISRKFTESDIESLAHITGYRVEKNFYDRRNYFVSSLWVKGRGFQSK